MDGNGVFLSDEVDGGRSPITRGWGSHPSTWKMRESKKMKDVRSDGDDGNDGKWKMVDY